MFAGARVILACRDMDRANRAAEEVRKRSGNGNVIVKKLDLASLQSVRELAKDVLASEERLDVLINNAGKNNDIWWWDILQQLWDSVHINKQMFWLLGVMSCPKWQTEDGFEMQFGVNHLGHFLLTNCLLDLLKKSTPSRVVNVSSLAHEKGAVFLSVLLNMCDFLFFFSHECCPISVIQYVLFSPDRWNLFWWLKSG